MSAATAIGIDIGGTGIKGATVDLATGELTSDRIKLATPKGGRPDDIVQTTKELLAQLSPEPDASVGVCFPAVVRHGRTMSAANVSEEWIGFEAEALFESVLARDIHFVNDADAAGFAEARFGAARDVPGVVILTTLGTGIGSAVLNDGILLPNTELGHIGVGHHEDYETRAAYSVKEREDLSWEKWAHRLQKYYRALEKLFSPDLFIVGGGVSKHHDEFLPLLDLNTPIVPAVLRNNAGILGAAALAASPSPTEQVLRD